MAKTEDATESVVTVGGQLAKFAGAIAGQTGLFTALLYYIGWVRTRTTAERLGLDVSLFGYSTQDFVLRSVDSALLPFGVILVGAIGFLVVAEIGSHAAASLGVRGAQLATLLVAGATCVGFVTIVAGVMVVRAGWGSDRGARLLLCGCTVSALALVIGPHVPAKARRVEVFGSPASRRWVRLLLAGVALDATFALVGSYANNVGVRRAQMFVTSLATKGDVVVTSDRPLRIDYPNVTTDAVVDPVDPNHPAAYRYRGLKLLARVGTTYFLVPSGGSSPTMTVSVPVDGVRLDYEWPRR